MAKKLYECTLTLTYYAYTDTPDSAADAASEALEDSYIGEIVDVREYKPRNPKKPFAGLSDHWAADSLVYTTRDVGEISLAEAYAAAQQEAEEEASDGT